MKRFLIILFCSIPFLVNANDCKPVVKEYPATKDNVFQIYTPEYTFFAPQAESVAFSEGLQFIFYDNKSKYIAYQPAIEIASTEDYINALGLENIAKNNKEILAIRDIHSINCNVTQVKLSTTDNSKVFIINEANDKPLRVLVIDEKGKRVDLIKIKGFTIDQVGSMMNTYQSRRG